MNTVTDSMAGRRRVVPGSSQAGFTLVELMISMTIGLFIVLALLTLLINVNRSNSEMTKSNRVIENGRFALQLLQADLSHAGFWGGFVPQFDNLTFADPPTDVPQDYTSGTPGVPPVTAVPDPCASWADLAGDADALGRHKANLLGIHVQGYEIPAVVPSPTVPVCAARVTNPQPSTDVLFVRHLETCAVGEAGCPAFAANELYFQVAQCGNTMPTPAYVMEQYDAANVDILFPFRTRAANCATATTFSPRRKFVSNLYYVRRFAVTDGDNLPTLMRSQFSCASGTCGFGTPDALIEGIESLRVEYGRDNVSDAGTGVNFGVAVAWADTANLNSPTNRGDGIPDGAYIRCGPGGCSAADLMNVVALKIYALVRSETTTPGYTDTKKYCLASACAPADLIGPFNDGYKRHVFTQTIRLTNISARRETP